MLDLLTNVLLAGAAVLTLAWLVAAQRRLVVRLARRFLALPRLQQVVLVLAVCISTVCAQKTVTNENAIIELSDNRIIESAEASASGSDDSRRAAENAEGKTDVVFSAENGDLRKETRSSSLTSATSDASVLRANTSLTSSSTNPCESVQSVANIVEKSAFWSFLTPSNSLVITWQNVLLHRLSENPVSFQVEFFANGDFTYRYDLSQLPSDAVLTNAYVIAAPGIGEPWWFSLTRRFRSLGGAEKTLEECVS